MLKQPRAHKPGKAHGGSVVVTSSRRTASTTLEMVKTVLGRDAYIYQWTGSAVALNPYRVLVKQSFVLFVSADSASMIADTCHSGTPTFLIEYLERYEIRDDGVVHCFMLPEVPSGFARRTGVQGSADS